MSENRIDIEVVDKVSTGIRKKFSSIAKVIRKADSSLERLKKELATMDASSLNKLTTASAKLTNARARDTTATARLTTANAKMTVATTRSKLAQQKLKTELERTTAAQARATIAKRGAAAASSRAKLALLRLTTAQNKLNRSTERSRRSFGGFLRTLSGVVALGYGAASAIRAGDSYTILQNKIQNVVDSEKQLVEVTKEVFAIAQKTRVPVQDTAQAFQRFDLALVELGASQKESLKLTETVNKALVLSGSTANESGSALLQLSQAFNKGKLDGDEFRTVMELMPTVADAIAKQMNVTRGALLNLAPQGKITAEVMRQAFANAREEIAERFAKVIPTLGQAFGNLKNAAIQFFGELNKSAGITEKISRGILFLADNFKLLGVALAATGAILLVAFGPALISSIGAASVAVKAFTVAMAANPLGLIIVSLTTAIALFAAFKDEIKVSNDDVVSLGDTFKATFQLIGEVVAPVIDFFKKAWNDAFNSSEEGSGSFLSRILIDLFRILDFAKTVVNKYLAIWVAGFNIITKTWGLFPEVLGDVLIRGSNEIIDFIEFSAKATLKFLNSIIKLANKAALSVGKQPIFEAFDVNVDFSRQKSKAINAASQIGTIFKDELSSAFTTDFLGNAFDAISKRAREIAGASGSSTSSLRPAGPPLPPEPPEANKDAEKRAASLEKINRELFSEFKLLGMLGPERENMQRFEQINNALLSKKIILTEKEAQGFKLKIELLQREKAIQGDLENIYGEVIGRSQEILITLEASNRAWERGIINTEQYARNLAALTLETSNLKIQMGDATFADVWISSFGQILQSYDGMLAGMTDSFGSFFGSLTDGFADSIGRAIVYGDDLAESLRNVARSALAELISSLIKVGIQYVINGAMAQTTAAATLATNAAVASSAAVAWAPAAALASLATLGANAAGAATAITGTMALSESMALASAAGFKDGGYTGDVGRNEVAGVVHGQEYVMPADVTARNRGTLEAMKRGESPQSNSVAMNVSIENYGSSEISVERISETDVRIIAREVVRKEASSVVASDISNPNGKVSRSLSQNTNAQRRR